MATNREIAVTKLSLAVSTISFVAFSFELAGQLQDPGISLWFMVEDVTFFMVVLLLLSGNVVYQLARLGYLQRQAAHRPLPQATLEMVYDTPAPRLAMLIPSYREEERVLRQTVLSAALIEYPERRVVVLIDDPPNATGEHSPALEASRRMIGELDKTFATRARKFREEHWHFLARGQAGELEPSAEAVRLAYLYDDLAEWIEALAGPFIASATPAFAHTDKLFIEKVLDAPAAQHRARAASLRSAIPSGDEIAREYQRLAALLKVEITSFERKRYANLSHQPNKAMNLNSYIALIGRSYREVDSGAGRELVECVPKEATLVVPPADYLLTLDADSLVLSDYALRLVRIMQDDPRIAVAQTPYSAVPDAQRLIERVAGATTDIQYIVHQGFTRFDATYWVGANAMLRMVALTDIRTEVSERGHRISVFIQDRTVIEDTGSTVDLIRRGWTLYNYPERLAYSATPADFGALIIQRRRWSNGGLIILGDLIRYLRERRRLGSGRGLIEALMRCYYLCSPAVANFGLIALLLYPWNTSLTSIWLPLSAAPYYFLYGRDLRLLGYRWSDLVRVYALNLLLLPVNVAGVLRSLQQVATGRKSAFGRTPKVADRTSSPPIHILFQSAMVASLVISVVIDIKAMRFANAVFSLINAALYVYAVTRFLGWRESWFDVADGLANNWRALARRRWSAPQLTPAQHKLLAIPAISGAANAAANDPDDARRKRSADSGR